MGIHVATLYKKKRELSEFNYALEKGRADGIAHVANRLFEAAIRGEHAPMIFYLKARAGWRDQGPMVEVNQNVTTGGTGESAELVNLVRDAIAVLRDLKVPLAIDLPADAFKTLPAMDEAD